MVLDKLNTHICVKNLATRDVNNLINKNNRQTTKKRLNYFKGQNNGGIKQVIPVLSALMCLPFNDFSSNSPLYLQIMQKSLTENQMLENKTCATCYTIIIIKCSNKEPQSRADRGRFKSSSVKNVQNYARRFHCFDPCSQTSFG